MESMNLKNRKEDSAFLRFKSLKNGGVNMSIAVMKENAKIKICFDSVYIITNKTASPVSRKKTKNIHSKEISKNAEKNYQKRKAIRNSVINEIINNNFSQGNISITLTFDPMMFDMNKIQELDFTHKEFKKFIQRMNRRYEDFIYLATFSRQENGTWHYHMITNMIMDESVNNIQNIWGNGSCECKNMNSGDYYTNVKDYMGKNMEAFADEKMGRHGYLCSENIVRSIVLRSDKEEDEELFRMAFARISCGGAVLIGRTETSMGITKQTAEEIVSGNFNIQFNEELTSELKRQGYSKVYSETEVYKSTLLYPFMDWFPPKKFAKLRNKILK